MPEGRLQRTRKAHGLSADEIEVVLRGTGSLPPASTLEDRERDRAVILSRWDDPIVGHLFRKAAV